MMVQSIDFITSIPTTWDETLVLEAAVADYILLARRKGKAWFLGGMTDDTARDLQLKLDFLGEGNYTMEIMKDGKNAHNHAEDYKKEIIEVNQNSTVQIHMVSGGGWAARIMIE